MKPDTASLRAAPCARYWGSDGTLCATHNGRFLSPTETRCDRKNAATPEPASEGLPSPEAEVSERADPLVEARDAMRRAVAEVEALPSGIDPDDDDHPYISRTDTLTILRDCRDAFEVLASPDTGVAEGAGLDAAWAAAEAVLPESKGRWGFSINSLSYGPRGWCATAAGQMAGEWLEGFGATPTAALKSLARLATPAPEEAPE